MSGRAVGGFFMRIIQTLAAAAVALAVFAGPAAAQQALFTSTHRIVEGQPVADTGLRLSSPDSVSWTLEAQGCRYLVRSRGETDGAEAVLYRREFAEGMRLGMQYGQRDMIAWMVVETDPQGRTTAPASGPKAGCDPKGLSGFGLVTIYGDGGQTVGLALYDGPLTRAMLTGQDDGEPAVTLYVLRKDRFAPADADSASKLSLLATALFAAFAPMK